MYFYENDMGLMSLSRLKHSYKMGCPAVTSWKCFSELGKRDLAYLNYCEVLEALRCLFHVLSAGEEKLF